jgi:glycerol-3-phosphate acyltransferase PlsY
VLADVLIVAAGYLIGAIPFGVVVVRLVRGEDIRAVGSGNIGATNVWRSYGRTLGLPVALLDVAKGCGPALLGLLAAGPWVGVLAGAAAMIGHARPVYLRFARGGKMVATAGGVAFALAPLAALGCVAIWFLVFGLLRYSSVASMVAAASLPVLCYAFGASWPVVGFGAFTSLGVLVLHRPNIKRLIAGTEPRFARAAPSA